MIRTDENALICDLAETYQIYDYKQFPPNMVAVFACGLKDSSRIKIKISGSKVSPEILMLTGIVDRLNLILWTKTKDAQNGRNRPKSVLDTMFKKESEVSAFASGKDFEEERQRLLNKAERR